MLLKNDGFRNPLLKIDGFPGTHANGATVLNGLYVVNILAVTIFATFSHSLRKRRNRWKTVPFISAVENNIELMKKFRTFCQSKENSFFTSKPLFPPSRLSVHVSVRAVSHFSVSSH